MIIDNFGTIKPNPYRFYVPRVMMGLPIVDEIDWSTWPRGRLMVVPDTRIDRMTDWKPTRWWRVTAPDGSLWCETSNEQEAREAECPGDAIQRLYERVESEWRAA